MAERLRICRVINAMWMGGVQKRLLELLPRLRELGCDPQVVTLRTKGELHSELARLEIPATHIRIKGRMHPRYIAQLSRFMRANHFDVVHTHMYQANVTGTIAAKIARVPCIISQIHNVDMYKDHRQARTDRMLMRLRDGMVCVSEAVRKNTAGHLGIEPNRLGVLLNGIDITPKNDPAARERILAELGLPADSVLIAHIARLHPQKGHRAFLAEFPAIVRAQPTCRLLLAGDGDEQPALEEIARSLGIAEQVRFLGSRNDVPDILAASDISILPSEKEGFSNVVLESMLYGAALVVTDVGGAREQIIDGADGIIVPPGQPRLFADCTLDLARDAALRTRLQAAGREKVRDFSLERMAERTLGLYESVLRRKGRWRH